MLQTLAQERVHNSRRAGIKADPPACASESRLSLEHFSPANHQPKLAGRLTQSSNRNAARFQRKLHQQGHLPVGMYGRFRLRIRHRQWRQSTMPQDRFIRFNVKGYLVAAEGRLIADPLQDQLRNRAVDIGFATAGHHLVAQHRHRPTSGTA